MRWVRPEGLHITLKFLGSIPPSKVELVRAAVERATLGVETVSVRVHGVGAFPNLRRPRVLWIGADAPGLAPLTARIDSALVAAGFAPAEREFSPHLTLGRVNSSRHWAALEAALQPYLEAELGSCEIATVTLYRSTPQRGVWAAA